MQAREKQPHARRHTRTVAQTRRVEKGARWTVCGCADDACKVWCVGWRWPHRAAYSFFFLLWLHSRFSSRQASTLGRTGSSRRMMDAGPAFA